MDHHKNASNTITQGDSNVPPPPSGYDPVALRPSNEGRGPGGDDPAFVITDERASVIEDGLGQHRVQGVSNIDSDRFDRGNGQPDYGGRPRGRANSNVEDSVDPRAVGGADGAGGADDDGGRWRGSVRNEMIGGGLNFPGDDDVDDVDNVDPRSLERKGLLSYLPLGFWSDRVSDGRVVGTRNSTGSNINANSGGGGGGRGDPGSDDGSGPVSGRWTTTNRSANRSPNRSPNRSFFPEEAGPLSSSSSFWSTPEGARHVAVTASFLFLSYLIAVTVADLGLVLEVRGFPPERRCCATCYIERARRAINVLSHRLRD